jgi:hypothetical protein
MPRLGSIGIAHIVARLTAHRVAAEGGGAPDAFNQREVDRVVAYLAHARSCPDAAESEGVPWPGELVARPPSTSIVKKRPARLS